MSTTTAPKRQNLKDWFPLTPEQAAARIAAQRAAPMDIWQTLVGLGRSTTSDTSQATLAACLDGIQDGKYQKLVDQIRAAQDEAAQRKLKSQLQGYLFSGTFAKRSRDHLTQHTGLLCLDVDHGDNPHLADRYDDIRAALGADRYVLALWESPRRGLKFLLRIDGSRHEAAFKGAEAYFRDRHGLTVDASGKDVSRLCYASYDPHLHRNASAALFDQYLIEEAPRTAPARKHSGHERTDQLTAEDVDSMLAVIPTRPPYDEWLKVLSAVFACTDYNTALAALQRWSPEEEPGEYEKKYAHRLQDVGTGSLIYLAQQHGWRREVTVERPAPVAAKVIPSGQSKRTLLMKAARDPQGSPDLWKRIEDGFHNSERGAGYLAAYAFEGEYLFDHVDSRWLCYDGRRWTVDETARFLPRMGLFVQDVFATAAQALRRQVEADLKSGNLDPQEVSKDPRTQAIEKLWAGHKNLNRRSYLTNAIKFAADRMPCLITDFDSDPLLLNCRNGTLDLRTGELRNHDPRNLCRKMVNADWDPDAKAPKFGQFIDTIMCGDTDLAAMLQKLLGTGVCGLTDWDFTAFCVGNGANGKSTLFDIVLKVLGDYGVSFNVEMLLGGKDKRDQVAAYELCALLGARLALGSEIPDGRAFNESLLKDLSGGDLVKARQPYGRPFEFAATHSLFIFGNHTPKITGADHGIWSRLKMIPFNHRFPRAGEAGNRPRSEVEAELLAEANGILRWLVDGFRAIRTEGLHHAAASAAATGDWREESDIFGAFLAAKCEVNMSASVTCTDLHEAARQYAESQRQRGPSPHEMKRRIEAVGGRVKKVMGVRFYEGISLLKTI